MDKVPPAILLVGGAPRVPVDAVRHLRVAATGATVRTLYRHLRDEGVDVEVLLSVDAVGEVLPGGTFTTRQDLDDAVARWIRHHPAGTVVMTAAVNDYEVASLEADGAALPLGAKIPSGRDEVCIRLRSAPKLVDALAGWGHRGALVACKYEDAATVIASARRLRERTGAVIVLANAIDGAVQALVDQDGVRIFDDRGELLRDLAGRLLAISRR